MDRPTAPESKEALSFSGPAAGLLRARALAKQGKWSEALEAMKARGRGSHVLSPTKSGAVAEHAEHADQEPGVRDYARDNYSDKFSLLVEVGARPQGIKRADFRRVQDKKGADCEA